MKKVGILTTYSSKNYGAALQAYALQKKLCDMNYDVEDIQYQHVRVMPKTVSDKNIFAYLQRRGKNLWLKIRNKVKDDRQEKLRNMMFEQFVSEHIRLSKEKYIGTDAFLVAAKDMDYDIYICGSDQIWNPIAYQFDPVYLLDFETGAKRISYAASIAYLDFSEEDKCKMVECLSGADKLSVREQSAADLLNPCTKQEIVQVPDPTFLLHKEEWLELKSDKVPDEEYLLVYLLAYNENPWGMREVIEAYAKEQQLKIICLPYTDMKFRYKNTEYRYDIAPNDFIQLLNGCSMIFTNSFHATALSVNLNKQFFVFTDKKKHSGIQSRLTEILKHFHLEKRMGEAEEFDALDVIDFEGINLQLAKDQAFGEKYLKESIEE